jgi:glycosyltransferase involved in cell wall biosynthesis
MSPLVHLHGPVGQVTGYGVHATNFAAALAEFCEVVTTAWPSEPATLAAVNARLAAERRRRPVATIHLMPPDLFPAPDPAAGPSIGYFVWESDVLPAAWRDACARVDRVWTASTWGRDVLVAGGVAAARVDVVPEGVDAALFRPDGPTLPALAADARFKFLHIGKWEERKFSEGLVRAFDEEFHADPGVVLVLGSSNPFIPGFDLRRHLRGMNLRRPNGLLGLGRTPEHRVIADIHRSCDAFVAPSRAEGWGLPIIEAMASGLPTITTRHSAMTDYAHDGNALLLDCRLVPIPEPLAEEAPHEVGRWAEPDVAQLRRHMRWCVEHRAEARALGLRAAAEIAGRWTWRHAAATAAGLLLSHRLHRPEQRSQPPPRPL